MAIGTYSDFQIINEQYYSGQTEVLQQATDAFNGASNNAIRLINRDRLGNQSEEMFFEQIADLVTRRDIASTSDATDKNLSSDERISPKVNRKVGPVATTIDSLKKIGSTPETFSFLIGRQTAKAKLVDWLNTGINSAVGAIASGAGGLDNTGTKIEFTDLVSLLETFGDNSKDIGAFVMHSGAFFNLFRANLSDYKIDTVAGQQIMSGNVSTMNKPVIVTDCDDLKGDDGGTPANTTYKTLALTQNAVVVEESENETVVTKTKTGKENLYLETQGEHAFNVTLRGYSFTSGQTNPTDTNLGAKSNWSLKSNFKTSAGASIGTTNV